MARATLKELQARWKEKEAKKDTPEHKFDSSYYPFWLLEEGNESHVRILFDGNESNPDIYHITKAVHTLTIEGKKQTIDCLRNYGDDIDCPICARSGEYFQAAYKAREDKNGEDAQKPNTIKGMALWGRPRQFLRAIIIKDGIVPTAERPSFEGKTLNLTFDKKIMDRIAADMTDMDDYPFVFKGGYNFVIRKSKGQGGYASYTGSGFSRKATDIKPVTLDDLKGHLPKSPTKEKALELLLAWDKEGN